MTGHTLLTVWSDSVMLSGFIWLLVLLILLYLARRPAHAALLGLGRMVHHALRLSARSIMRLEQRLTNRNRAVLLAMAAEQQERIVETEFQRVSHAVARDLGHYPALHRALSEQITRIDDDYRRSTEVPPAPPAWLEAVDAVANIPAKDDPAVNKILEDIHATLERSCHNTVMEYRAASHRRHKLLRRMLPYWRRLRDTLERVDRNIANVEERSARIDHHMERYEAIRANTDHTVRAMAASTLSRFVIAGLVLAVAGLAGFVNYNLIARPMAELMGGASGSAGAATLAGYPIAEVAALFMVLLQVLLGLFLLELMRVTRLFPVIGAWDGRRRQVLAWAVFAMLVIGAFVEASLAFQRDYLLAQDAAVVGSAAQGQGQALALTFQWIPAIAQMFMGLLLPFVLAFTAIPLETFLYSARNVLGIAAVGLLRLTAYLLRLLGQLISSLCRMLVRIYDLLIFLPLAVEHWIRAALYRGVENEQAAFEDARRYADVPEDTVPAFTDDDPELRDDDDRRIDDAEART